MASRGLVIGKFWPPHQGHSYLVERAADGCDALTVVVCDDPGQDIPASVRASWLRELHPNTRVITVPDIGKDDDSEAWALYTREFLGYSPDVVFTSESYGDAYARYLGAEHVSVDPARAAVPCAGREVRRRPLANWNWISPPARAWYAVRVCLLGAESTGTTTLARALAEHYDTVWVPEYGRDYSAEKSSRGEAAWATPEFVHIASEQGRREDAAARGCNGLLVCDTDAFATCLWHERYLGTRSLEVEAVAEERRGPGTSIRLYLLTDTDVPFVQDGTRDGEHLRVWMHGLFKDRLKETGRPYLLLAGDHRRRVAEAVRAVDALLHEP